MMLCRNSSSDPVGEFDCAYGFPCNTVTRTCDCSSDNRYEHDTTFMRIPNCGLPVVALYAGYIVTSTFSILVAVFSLYTARGRKPATKQFLYIGALWTTMLPCIQLSHYLEGGQFGVSTVVLFYVTIQLVNVQVVMFSFQILSLLALLSKPVVVKRLRKFMTWYLAFWTMGKILPAILMLCGVIIPDFHLFNATILSGAILLMVEVAMTTTAQYCAMKSLIRELHSIAENDSSYLRKDKVSAVLDFSERLGKVLPVAVIYALIVWGLGLGLIVLYGIYGFAVPFMWVLYVLMMISWPTLALNCVMLSRDAAVKNIEQLEREEDAKTFSMFVDHGQALRKHEKGISLPRGALFHQPLLLPETIIEDQDVGGSSIVWSSRNIVTTGSPMQTSLKDIPINETNSDAAISPSLKSIQDCGQLDDPELVGSSNQ